MQYIYPVDVRLYIILLLFEFCSKDVRLPVMLQRAMAAEAEAAREARAKVIAAEGEQKASRALKEAADVINESPAALQVKQPM
jgi:regulator of protease activity HflC (stomatin/prohibitin superfamily)